MSVRLGANSRNPAPSQLRMNTELRFFGGDCNELVREQGPYLPVKTPFADALMRPHLGEQAI